jgi:hypothetical protein
MANAVIDQMLAAAANAAGATWGKIEPDLEGFAQNLVQDSAQIASDLATGKIDEDEANVQFKLLADYSAIVANYAEAAVKAAAQAAFNAAIDTLWAAVTSAAKI